MNQYMQAAVRLHQYMGNRHWNGKALVGPDPGIRFNAKIGRFVKSYLSFVPWSDQLTYMQSQAYWISSNWLLFDLLQDEKYRDIALACTQHVSAAQRPAGYWEYPNPEWKGRIATVEGCFAALAMMESYARAGESRFLTGARRWYDYVLNEVRFQEYDGTLAINYFANVSGGMVPNNSTLALWTFARLSQVTADKAFCETCAQMVRFLQTVQLPSGELPYVVTDLEGNGRIHFLCYQYNAFEFMDLVSYFRITNDEEVWPVLEKLAAYLSTGVTDRGACRHDCSHTAPEVLYYSVAIAQALSQATTLGLGDYSMLVDRAYLNVTSRQRADGSFAFHSRCNYAILCDRRSYPRYLSMILNHLLRECMNEKLLGQDSVRLGEAG